MAYGWIVTKKDSVMHCKRCGTSEKIPLPEPRMLAVYFYSDACKAFIDQHYTCKKQ